MSANVRVGVRACGREYEDEYESAGGCMIVIFGI